MQRNTANNQTTHLLPMSANNKNVEAKAIISKTYAPTSCCDFNDIFSNAYEVYAAIEAQGGSGQCSPVLYTRWLAYKNRYKSTAKCRLAADIDSIKNLVCDSDIYNRVTANIVIRLITE